MKKAFTLLELIFVIVLIGVLSGIGFYTYRPNTPLRDAQYTLLKLKEARYRSIGYDALHSAGCVTLEEEALEDTDESVRHDIKSTLTHTARNDMICFDALGQPHDMGYSINLNTLAHAPIDIVFTDSSENTKSTAIRLFPQSGYAIIIGNN